MSAFAVRVVRLAHPVTDHPNADRLSLIRVGGYAAISAKLFGEEAAARGVPEGAHRYREGDLVAYLPEASVLPESLLVRMGFWKDGRGTLAGAQGNRVTAMRLRGIFSQGVLFPVEGAADGSGVLLFDGARHAVAEGDDVAGLLGIAKYEPPIPAHMAGEVCNLSGHVVRFDIESVQTVPDLFAPSDAVVATEKLHGTFVQFGFVPGLNHADCPGDIYVTSKGIGNKGLALKRNEANRHNLYVRAVDTLLKQGVEGLLRGLSERGGGSAVRVFGEIYGRGVQDLHYGQANPQFRAFDIKIGDRWLNRHEFLTAASPEEGVGLEMVPELYVGPYDLVALEAARDGKTVLGGGGHMREGIVIRCRDASDHPIHGRRIGKWVSPDYLLRKGAGEEVQ